MRHPLKLINIFYCIVAVGLTVAITSCISDPNVDAQYREQLAVCRSLPQVPKGPQYRQKAIELSKSCESLISQGHDDSDLHFYLGRLFVLGEEKEKVIEQLRIASAKGSAKGMTLLGRLVELKIISVEAAGRDQWSLYEQAAALGDPVAQVYLARSIYLTVQPETDESRRRRYALLMSASAQGYAIADYYLGEFHDSNAINGKSAEKKLAVSYLERAARGGVRDAVEMLRAMDHDISIYGKLEDMETTARGDDLYRP
ncbi:MAG: sel1 repeat family protein [Gammaproteobacteria bacterium]|nr:sel1 repeat family protein [Gammaproteobacteria bacterium]